jgi:hypothetical protein
MILLSYFQPCNDKCDILLKSLETNIFFADYIDSSTLKLIALTFSFHLVLLFYKIYWILCKFDLLISLHADQKSKIKT